ncbi:CidA/LrgA family protein [Oricola cellulosilytica]|uniref:CidA/LrgA family protein n=1 Tax=Oricola cellulosilytica TaxID=1429082 RepID=A0A4R0P563_9HYPH|nr:CidA/LrgA family protein [Oricola cellulosilytica]TCD10958.1 CidA/LrgA family protein [Oricola cellulosilytica]
MLNYLTLIFICQLAGEAFVVAVGLPVPGPVMGMALLFAGLMIHGGIPEDLQKVGGALLANLSLLFVPAGTGIMVHLSLLTGDGIAVSVALVVSTVATIAVTGLLMQFLTARKGSAKSDAE